MGLTLSIRPFRFRLTAEALVACSLQELLESLEFAASADIGKRPGGVPHRR